MELQRQIFPKKFCNLFIVAFGMSSRALNLSCSLERRHDTLDGLNLFQNMRSLHFHYLT
jgi:hypothetical protein